MATPGLFAERAKQVQEQTVRNETQTIAHATQSLIQTITAIDDLFADMENLTDPTLPHEALLTEAQKKGMQVVRSRMRKIERAGGELSTLYDSKKSYDLRAMLRILEQSLQRSLK